MKKVIDYLKNLSTFKSVLALTFIGHLIRDIFYGATISSFLSVGLFAIVIFVLSFIEFVEKYKPLTIITNGNITTEDESTSNK